jgi:PAS domain S-box-containing protein
MESITTDESILVLHVDDDTAFTEMVQMYLKRLGDDITVISEADAEAGLERLEADTVDCIVSDYNMPGLDGLDFLRAVREEYPNLPFILFTARGSEQIAAKAIDRGVTFYLQKGGSEAYDLLVNRVRNAVERYRSERQARIARDRLLEMYEQTDGFFVLDENWRISYWNQHMAKRTGRLSKEVTGMVFLEAFPEAAGTELHDHYQQTMETKEPAEFETYFEPHEYWVRVQVYPVDEGLFVHSREITAKKENEREISQRNHILKSFANTVSHDLRNPLNVAEGNLQLAQKTGDFHYLEEVAQAHNRMRNLIDELLRIARQEDLVLDEISLRNAAREAWATVATEEMELVVEEDDTFRTDANHFRRLFENLYWNALSHGEASTIRVGLLNADGFYVADDGDGIPRSKRSQVFETGFSTEEEGTGYGLAIVQGICIAHDWDITLADSENGGARFEITTTDPHSTET